MKKKRLLLKREKGEEGERKGGKKRTEANFSSSVGGRRPSPFVAVGRSSLLELDRMYFPAGRRGNDTLPVIRWKREKGGRFLYLVRKRKN